MAIQEADLVHAEAKFGVTLPADYRELLITSNGMTEVLPNAYLVLWPLEEVVRVNTVDEYGLAQSLPHFIAIGSDGGGELIGFDTRTAAASVVLVNAVSASWADASHQAATLSDLLTVLRAGGSFSFGA